MSEPLSGPARTYRHPDYLDEAGHANIARPEGATLDLCNLDDERELVGIADLIRPILRSWVEDPTMILPYPVLDHHWRETLARPVLDAFGIVGTHLAIANIGRLYIYGPPGVMLLRQRHGGDWMLRPAFTWGFSFYLTEFSIPGWEQEAQLFANVTKVWTEGDQRNGIDMVGLSLTFKK